ncbi:MAG: periplasmic heavy metal sensor [Hyphomicrobiaceae bacterium]|nr:periplasmic heavy metal sensor [Hyphomicrobiaceae bacterium]
MTDKSPPVVSSSQPQVPRWMAILLALSVGLNLIVAGVMAGRLLGPPHHKGHGFSSYIDTLPAERRAGFTSIVSEGRQQLKQHRDRIDMESRAVISDLRAEPFDRARFVATLGRLESAHGALRQGAADLIVALAEKMTPQERLAYAEWRERREQRRENRRKRRKESDEE